MNNDRNEEDIKNIGGNEIQKHIKDSLGIEIVTNELLPEELESQGYRKMDFDEKCYFAPIFQFAPQIVVNKINKNTVEQGFKAATDNSFKCILDPSMHLATIKGTTDVYIGGALDNTTNKVAGQARWLKNDSVLAISNAPQLALNAFNALSIVTGQYFMAEINVKLSEIKDGIDGIKEYIDAIKQSELETALQDLFEILDHVRYIKNDRERVRTTLIQIDGIRKVSKEGINLYKKQIEKIMRNATVSDKETIIKNNTEELKKNVVQYRYAVYIYNLAQILKIYLNNITDTEELSLYRDEISALVKQYKNMFKEVTTRIENYYNETKTLNNASKTQKVLSLGGGIAVSILGSKYGSNKMAVQTASLVNDIFDDSKKKKKEGYVLSQREYQIQMNDSKLIDSPMATMDKYIDEIGKKAAIVSVDGECYIKFIDR